jgi:hypothetical protein
MAGRFCINAIKAQTDGDWLDRYEAIDGNKTKNLNDFIKDMKNELVAKYDSHLPERELRDRVQHKN